jgi:hypothetical protein
MQRTDVDLRALAGSGKDAAQKLEDAVERLLRLAASGTDNSKHFESIVSFCDAGNYSTAVRSCAFALVPSCAQYEGSAWGKLVAAVIAEVTPTSPPSPRSSHLAVADKRSLLRRVRLRANRRRRHTRPRLRALRVASSARARLVRRATRCGQQVAPHPTRMRSCV